jgi:hypothetical protein
MNKLEKLNNINYYVIHLKMPASQRGIQPRNILHSMPVQHQRRIRIFGRMVHKKRLTHNVKCISLTNR